MITSIQCTYNNSTVKEDGPSNFNYDPVVYEIGLKQKCMDCIIDIPNEKVFRKKLELIERPTLSLQDGDDEHLQAQERSHWLMKQLLTPSEAAELVRISHPLGPDPSVETRTKSICFFMLGDDGKFRKLSQNFFIQPKVYNEYPKQGNRGINSKTFSS